METWGAIYEVDCNNCLKKYTGKAGRKLKERMKEHNDNGEKSRKYKKVTGLLKHMKNTGHSIARDDIRIILRGMSPSIPGNVLKDSGQCRQTFRGLSSNIPENVIKR